MQSIPYSRCFSPSTANMRFPEKYVQCRPSILRITDVKFAFAVKYTLRRLDLKSAGVLAVTNLRPIFPSRSTKVSPLSVALRRASGLAHSAWPHTAGARFPRALEIRDSLFTPLDPGFLCVFCTTIRHFLTFLPRFSSCPSCLLRALRDLFLPSSS